MGVIVLLTSTQGNNAQKGAIMKKVFEDIDSLVRWAEREDSAYPQDALREVQNILDRLPEDVAYTLADYFCVNYSRPMCGGQEVWLR